MKENKFIAFVKANYVWLLTIIVLGCTFIGLLGSIVTSKPVTITYHADWEWYEVARVLDPVSGEKLPRAGVYLSQLINEGTFVPFLVMYNLVIVAIVLVVLGKYIHTNFYIGATLLLLCTGIFFLTSNTFYDLALCTTAVKEPNLFEELHAVAETKLSFGSTFASILCFAGGLLSYSLANTKDSFSISDMAEVGVLSAMAIGLQFIRIPIGVTGGSINLGLVPLFVIALRHGATKGFVASAFIYGIITCLTDGYGFNTYPFDYLLGFGGIAALGFFKNLCFNKSEKGYNPLGFLYIAIGVVIASVVRFVGSTASSMINYGYSLAPACAYNVIYVFVTGGVSLIAMEALFIPLARINKRFPTKE